MLKYMFTMVKKLIFHKPSIPLLEHKQTGQTKIRCILKGSVCDQPAL